MASEQINVHEAIAQAVAEVTGAAIQAMAATGVDRSQNAGARLGRSMMKQPNFKWEAEYKYNKLKNFRLEVNNIFKSYNTSQTEQLAIIKKLARQ